MTETNNVSDQANIDDILDLAETDIVSQESEQEELIDIRSFDESGEIKTADVESQLLAKAQHGNEDAIAELSKKMIGTPENSTEAEKVEEPAKPESQGGVDELLNNLGQLSQDNTDTSDDTSNETSENSLAEKAQKLEDASKTYSEKTFESTEESVEEEPTTAPQAASTDDIAKAMANLTEPEPEPEVVEERITAEEVEDLQKKVKKTVALKAVPGISGLQVGFPIEVLAEAIRPMISDWIEDNLPVLVEKLVKEELSKLADK
ncbi:MAG: DUF2497 domain-containing protein [Proteobacteria bacterium]|nr:DUF2497 domain-containing protein [Pseudomonadota bacterium]